MSAAAFGAMAIFARLAYAFGADVLGLGESIAPAQLVGGALVLASAAWLARR